LANLGNGTRDNRAFLQTVEGRLSEQVLHHRTHNDGAASRHLFHERRPSVRDLAVTLVGC
jgi:hypothetical protein